MSVRSGALSLDRYMFYDIEVYFVILVALDVDH